MHSTKKTLSIIIPNHNKSKFISFTIDSILSQTKLPNEIIIVDDCSTDNSKTIIQSYVDKYPNLIKMISLYKNKGVQEARNIGVLNAKSNYICFVDSDDVYINNKAIELQMRKVKKNRLVGIYQLIINDAGVVQNQKARYRDKIRFKYLSLVYIYRAEMFLLYPQHYIFSKQAFNEVGKFDFPYNLYEDSDLLLKLIFHNIKPKTINIEGKGYRMNKSDKSHLSNAEDTIHKKVIHYLQEKHRKQYFEHISFIQKIFLYKEKKSEKQKNSTV